MARKPIQRPKRLFHRDRATTTIAPAKLLPKDWAALVPAGSQVIHNPPGEIKMSEVLEDFVEPWIRDDTSMVEHQNLLNLSIVAWNVALLPESDRERKTNELLTALIPRNLWGDLHLAQRLVAELVARKLADFAPIRRFLYSCQLTELDDGHRHLSVVSTFVQT